MIAIAVSDPKVANTLNLSAQFVSHEDEPVERAGKAAPVLLLGLGSREKRTSNSSSAQMSATFKYKRAIAAGHMPFDRKPVRRGGISSGN